MAGTAKPLPVKPLIDIANLPWEFPRPFSAFIELEFTNRCNAKCAMCPRSDMPDFGVLTPETLTRLLERYAADRNRPAAYPQLPRISVAGGGEPLINRHAITLFKLMIEHGHEVHLFTNGAPLTTRMCESLAGAGLKTIRVSFLGIRKEEYETAMCLPYESTLGKVDRLIDALKGSPTELSITCVKSGTITSSDEEIVEFWGDRGVFVHLCGVTNRGGLLTSPKEFPVGETPDDSQYIWCPDLYFMDTYDCYGTALLCCCNFFNSNQIKLGNVHDDTLEDMRLRKERILLDRPIPAMCRACISRRDDRTRFMLSDYLIC
jgi:sulfatase maturation enzyme AslB (radical SAM superfamily)